MAAMAEFESWKNSFMVQLLENTKDAVEVARRHYLESRLANGIKREMREMKDKYELLERNDDGQPFRDTMMHFELLEKQVELAMLNLKEKSDKFCEISAHKLPYIVERMTYDELKRVKLPNYSRISISSSSGLGGATSEDNESTIEEDDISFGSQSVEFVVEDTGDMLPSQEQDVEMKSHPDDEAAEGKDALELMKPPVLARRKRLSFKKTFSAAWNQIVLHSAESAGNKRLSRLFDHSVQIS